MKTREPPLSLQSRGKAAASQPIDKRPMERFRLAAAKVMAVDPAKVRAVEEQERKARRRKRKE